MTVIRAAFVFALIAVSLAACGSVTDADELKKTQTDELCKMYYYLSPKTSAAISSIGTDWPEKKMEIRKEMDRRNAVTPDNWPLIDQGKIRVGMNECELNAAWGHPLRIDHVGESTHYIYSLVKDVYLADGQVTTFKF